MQCFLSFFILWTAIVEGFMPSTPPPYCTTDMSTRDIPPLTSTQTSMVDSLIQVQAVIRHGSRTPWGKFKCWENYNVSWNDCNVTELMLANPSYTSQTRAADWLFRKLFDGSPNLLGGNCLTGQLISRGYVQESGLGTVLRNAYIGETGLKLYRSDSWNDVNTSRIYLRSDDETRTLMSGQLLMQNMFNTTDITSLVPCHTGDYQLDQISPNKYVCPRLNEVSAAAYSSSEWVEENTSAAVTDLTSSLDDILGAGYWDWDHVLDCFQTTVCTGREIPDGSGSTVMTDSMFNDTIAQVEATYAYQSLYNNSWWSKLAMGNVMWNIKSRISAIINGTSYAGNGYNGADTSYQLVIYSAHDTTIMPILAALFGDQWDGYWAGYASLLTFEIYNSSSTTHYIRIIYNGKPLIFPGCSDDLCDLDIFFAGTDWVAENMPCAAENDAIVDSSSNNSSNTPSLSTGGWVGLCLISAVIGAALSALIFRNQLRGKNDDEQPLNEAAASEDGKYFDGQKI